MTVEEMYELTVSPFREWWKGVGMTIRARETPLHGWFWEYLGPVICEK